MRLARIVGFVSLSRSHPSFVGATWKIVQPFSLEGLQKDQPDGEELVAWDQLSTGLGSLVAISEGAEAAMPFRPKKVPLDCYCACMIDSYHLSVVSPKGKDS
ncbi:MAG TPA: EutN/CcmL family microcompartment protein [Gemmatales bacterium]|nr:EutN/CcmL family microcompartment protein [Gemmatales bacterium]HMP16781.1 EutN/CcmL family microcompartment protein [Gemmatales bacterium]